MADQKRTNWIDETTQAPRLDQYARQLDSFAEAMADGRVDQAELGAQEQRLTALMKEIDPQLDDALHARVTELLCELTAYNIMKCFHELQQARPQSAFRG